MAQTNQSPFATQLLNSLKQNQSRSGSQQSQSSGSQPSQQMQQQTLGNALQYIGAQLKKNPGQVNEIAETLETEGQQIAQQAVSQQFS